MSRGAATNQSTEPSTNESEGCKSSQSCEPTLVTHYFRVSTSLEYHQNQWDSRSELETIDTTLWTNIKYSLKITNFHEKTWSNFVFFENLLNHCKVLATTKGKRIPQNLLWFAIVKCCSVNISESAAFIFSEMSALSDDWFYWFFVWEVRWDVWLVSADPATKDLKVCGAEWRWINTSSSSSQNISWRSSNMRLPTSQLGKQLQENMNYEENSAARSMTRGSCSQKCWTTQQKYFIFKQLTSS